MMLRDVVLGIDPAKTRLGFGVTDRVTGEPLEARVSDVPAGMSLYHHAERCMDELSSLYRPALVVIEANRYSAAAMPGGKATACAAAYDHGAIAALVELAVLNRWPSAELWWATPAEWQSITKVPRVDHRQVPDAKERRKQNLELLRYHAAQVLRYELPASPSGIPDVDAAAAACLSFAGWVRAFTEGAG